MVMSKTFQHWKQLLITQPVLCMPTAKDNIRLEIDTSKSAAGGVLFQFKQDQWVLIGNHIKKLPQAVQITGLQN